MLLLSPLRFLVSVRVLRKIPHAKFETNVKLETHSYTGIIVASKSAHLILENLIFFWENGWDLQLMRVSEIAALSVEQTDRKMQADSILPFGDTCMYFGWFRKNFNSMPGYSLLLITWINIACIYRRLNSEMRIGRHSGKGDYLPLSAHFGNAAFHNRLVSSIFIALESFWIASSFSDESHPVLSFIKKRTHDCQTPLRISVRANRFGREDVPPRGDVSKCSSGSASWQVRWKMQITLYHP